MTRKKGVSKISGNNHQKNARASIPEDVLNFLNADIGDYISWDKIEDVLCREIITMEVIKPDGSKGVKLCLQPLQKKIDF